MARCPSCNKFVSNGEPEAELQSGEDFDVELSDGKLIVRISPEVQVTVPCGECGQALKETYLNFEMEAEHVCDKLPKEEPKDGIDVEGSVEVEPVDDYRTTDRKGKPIKNPRYQAHLYGAEVLAYATCPFCNESIEFSEKDTVESSSMDECG